MSDFRLPRLRENVPIINPKTGNPTVIFMRWIQSFAQAIETQEAAQDAIIAAVVAAQAAAVAAQVSAAAAQVSADAAQVAVDAAEGDITIIYERTENARQFLALD